MTSELLSADLKGYLDGLVPRRPEEVLAMEEYARQHGFPIIGPAAGYYCYLMARLVGANKVFELGSGYGYSTAWFCKAVRENGGGEVHHVVWDKKLSDMAKTHLSNLGYDDIVKYTVGEAVAALKRTGGEYDLIFNDIDKHDYPASLPVISDHLRKGGLMIVDNLLWSGKIFDPSDRSPATEGVRQFTQLVTNDPSWIASIVPIRDGVLVAMKK
jgi:caffeoyl-CoA O-methyltransferase